MRWMDRRMTMAPLLVAAIGLGACSGATSNGAVDGAAMASGYGANVDRDVARVRAATEAFHSIDAAVAAGYPRAVAQCLRHPEHGAMGHHHMNRALLDDTIELEKPEILLYSLNERGEYVLNGVEYIVPYSARPRDATPPRVMRQPLKRSDELRLWYLHVWVWTENPAGLFADWNPRVDCRN